MNISSAGLDLVKTGEGFEPYLYNCPGKTPPSVTGISFISGRSAARHQKRRSLMASQRSRQQLCSCRMLVSMRVSLR
jgi:hypothetical protein